MKLPKIDRKPYPINVDGIGELLVHHAPMRLTQDLDSPEGLTTLLEYVLKDYDGVQEWIADLTHREMNDIFIAMLQQAPSFEAQAEGNLQETAA